MSDALLPGSLTADDERQTADDPRHRTRPHPPKGHAMPARAAHASTVRATILRAVCTVIFAVLSAAALFYSIVQTIDAYSLAQHYLAIQGHVVQTQCASRLQVGYTFDAGGAAYRGNGMAHKRCDAYRVGEAIAVYYSPEDPSISLSEVTPQQEWRTRLALVATETAVLAVVGLMFGLRRRA